MGTELSHMFLSSFFLAVTWRKARHSAGKEGDLEAWCYCKDQPFLGMGSSLGEYFWRFGFPLRMKERDLRTVWSPKIPWDFGTITVIDKALANLPRAAATSSSLGCFPKWVQDHLAPLHLLNIV